jgi:hypothetical protein
MLEMNSFFFTLHSFLEVGKTQDLPSKFWQTLGDALTTVNNIILKCSHGCNLPYNFASDFLFFFLLSFFVSFDLVSTLDLFDNIYIINRCNPSCFLKKHHTLETFSRRLVGYWRGVPGVDKLRVVAQLVQGKERSYAASE